MLNSRRTGNPLINDSATRNVIKGPFDVREVANICRVLKASLPTRAGLGFRSDKVSARVSPALQGCRTAVSEKPRRWGGVLF